MYRSIYRCIKQILYKYIISNYYNNKIDFLILTLIKEIYEYVNVCVCMCVFIHNAYRCMHSLISCFLFQNCYRNHLEN